MPEPTVSGPTFIDLFAGCGGASLGFLEAGFRCLLAVDFDPAAVKCYNQNLQGPRDAGAIHKDLSSLNSHDAVLAFLAENDISPDGCDALVGGPPCQSFSVVGRTKIQALMKADEDSRQSWEETNRKRTTLFEAYALFLEVLAPRWFFFENVPAIRSHNTYSEIEKRFATLTRPDGSALSYDLVPKTYWASDYGVPQRRRRFILVGSKKNLGLTGWTPPWQSVTPSVSDALDDLPPVASGHRENRIRYLGPAVSEYQKLMRSGICAEDSEFVTNHVGRDHNADDVALFGRMEQGARFSDEAVQKAILDINPEHKLAKYSKDKFQDKLHKLIAEDPAWTVTAHLQKDCYKFIHHRQARTITVREAARLQSFPDRFSFPEALGPAFRLIGNAVPPLLAQAFAESFVRSDPYLGCQCEPARRIVPDSLWARIARLPALHRPVGLPGRQPLALRSVVAAGLKVELEGAEWEEVVGELNGAKVVTYQKHLRKLKKSGAWARIVEFAREPAREVVQQTSLSLPGS